MEDFVRFQETEIKVCSSDIDRRENNLCKSIFCTAECNYYMIVVFTCESHFAYKVIFANATTCLFLLTNCKIEFVFINDFDL